MPTSTNGPPLKRRRTEEELEDNLQMTEAVNATPPVRSPEMWLDDGSVVLQAENVQFRVHRTILARNSGIFRDLFMVPQPKGEPSLEDCPIVLLPDSAEDVKHMLVSLYDRSYSSTEAMPFKVAAAMIRMGRKYDIPHLLNGGLNRLISEFPSKLAEWEKLPPHYTHLVQEEGLLFDIVNLALENNIQAILPAAYYLCVQDLNDLLSGIKRSDGSIARLPSDVQRTCIIGRERILQSQSQYTFAWVELMGTGEQVDCSLPQVCTEIGNQLTKEIWIPLPDVSRTLEKWSSFISLFPEMTDRACPNCREDARAIHESGRQRVWDMLPTFFDLPDWADLKNFEG
ncbi:hypothetical protein FA15DRAFT_671032 [Coprinopsis marcescibilis]|uniref:BTB domain-containing protein n=1 Tax=Coprinopsis marcescibilis TaxID=230819 RepID=A0A5C3KRV8_COPMA|nr:hypothetical protein FA15DRAFT_671032 [Coprinopsis marcescibilis]